MQAAANVEEYLAACPSEHRAALEAVRTVVRSMLPDAAEVISYGMPTFRDRGRMVVSFGAFKDHCSFFPMSMAVIERHADELEPFRAAKGTLHFRLDHPLPPDLVRAMVAERMAENAERGVRA